MSVSDSLARLVVPRAHLYPEVVVGNALRIFCSEDRVNDVHYEKPVLSRLTFGKRGITKVSNEVQLKNVLNISYAEKLL